MAAVTAGASPATGPDRRGLVPARTAGPAAADRSAASARPGRTLRSWPLLVLAAPAAAEVWSGWVGIAQKTGFGLVSPLPGIWPALHLDTTVTLPVGVEAYAAYALRAWLSGEPRIGDRTRRFAKWSAISSFALGMAGQIAYHLLAQAGAARAPWPVTMIVSCLPAGPGPGHGDRAGPHAAHRHRAGCPGQRSNGTGHGVVPGPVRRGPERTGPGPARGPRVRSTGRRHTTGAAGNPRSRADHSTGAAGYPDADGPGAPHRPQARRNREASVSASSARRRCQRLQRIAQRPGPQAQRPTSKPEDKPPVTGGQAPRRRRRPCSPANAARPLQSGPHSRLDKRSEPTPSLDFALCRQQGPTELPSNRRSVIDPGAPI
jgi:hypothetical protein